MGRTLVNRTSPAVVIAALGAAGLACGAAHGADTFTQVSSNSMTLQPGELLSNWGATPLALAPSLQLNGFDTFDGNRVLMDSTLFARVTFSNIRVSVLNASQFEHGPLVADGESGFGAEINQPFVLMDQVPQWESQPILAGNLPNFGTVGEIELSFEAIVDLSSSISRTFVESNQTYGINMAASLDARTLISPDNTLAVFSETNPVSEWTVTLDTWAEYTYTLVPAPGAGVCLLGFACLASRRRR